MKTGIVSIIMPLYNALPYVKEAIESVQKQSMSNWDLWIIDDCSTDGSVEYIKTKIQEDERIHILFNERNSGAAISRNRGIDASKGEYIAFLDSDDVWHTDKLEKQLLILQNGATDMVCSSYALIDENGRNCCEDFCVPSIVDFRRMKRQNVIGCSSLVLKRDSLGLYRFRKEYYHEDYALWLELLQNGRTVTAVPEVLLDYRIRRGSRSWGKFHSAKEHWYILKELLHLPLREQILCMSFYSISALKKYCPKRRRKHGKSQADSTAESAI